MWTSTATSAMCIECSSFSIFYSTYKINVLTILDTKLNIPNSSQPDRHKMACLVKARITGCSSIRAQLQPLHALTTQPTMGVKKRTLDNDTTDFYIWFWGVLRGNLDEYELTAIQLNHCVFDQCLQARYRKKATWWRSSVHKRKVTAQLFSEQVSNDHAT